jgi:imidazolonepropionase-like amidohydrolase
MERMLPVLPGLVRTALATPGLTLLYGTDATAGAHGRNAEDLVCRVREAGQAPMDALVSATSRNAAALGLGDRIGTLAPGYEADLIALDGDPLQEIEAVRRVTFVMKGGKVFLRP